MENNGWELQWQDSLPSKRSFFARNLTVVGGLVATRI